MSLTDAERDLYLRWYRSTHLADPLYARPLGDAFHRFRHVFRDSHTSTTTPQIVLARIMQPVIEHFTFANSMINRWPMSVRRILNRSQPTPPLSGNETDNYHIQPPPFHTWAQPRFLERRKQAVAVWYNLLHFLVLNWSGYGGKNGQLYLLGLQPTRRCCDIIDDLRLYATLPSPLRPRRKAVIDMVEEFFFLVIRDPKPTPRTNPLLWWIAVLIHSEVNEPQPRLPIPGLEDTLTFSTKLEALDHYARVLVFHQTFMHWTSRPGILQPVPAWKHEVPLWVDAVDISWVDRDRETPPSLHEPDLTSQGWTDFHDTLRNAVDTWLVSNTVGPLHEIACLEQGTLPSPRPTSSPPPLNEGQSLTVHFTAVQDWSSNPGTLSGAYPASLPTTFSSLRDANRAVRRAIVRTLKNELDSHEGALHLDELDEMYAVGQTDGKVVQWDTVEEVDGTLRSRAIFVDGDENVKVTAWIEESRPVGE